MSEQKPLDALPLTFVSDRERDAAALGIPCERCVFVITPEGRCVCREER